jgi:pilus assembly protein CpaF
VLRTGPLELPLRDKSISDILVNTYKNVCRAGGVLEKVGRISGRSALHMRSSTASSAVGRRVDDSSPMVDARLLDGSRVNAIIPPLAVDGPLPRSAGFWPSVSEPTIWPLLRALTGDARVPRRTAWKARLNGALISGGTGAGKTTLSTCCPASSPSERIVTIEDAAELQLTRSTSVRLETRPANVGRVARFASAS